MLSVTVSVLASFILGLHTLSLPQVWLALHAPTDHVDRLILLNLRLPRTALALVCGAVLALAGLFMQTATRNPLAEPGLTGVNAGAVMAVVLLTLLSGTQSLWLMSFTAVSGAMLMLALVFTISALSGLDKNTFLLVGASMSGLASAVTQCALILNERAMEDLLFWLAGGFADRPWQLLPWLLLLCVSCWLLALSRFPALDLLLNDDALAQSAGVSVLRTRLGLLFASALLTGLAVAICGPVGFLGLIAPHMARTLGARTHKQLLIISPLCGMLIALLGDIAARFIVSPAEAPITSMLAIVGAPWLLWLLRTTHWVRQ